MGLFIEVQPKCNSSELFTGLANETCTAELFFQYTNCRQIKISRAHNFLFNACGYLCTSSKKIGFRKQGNRKYNEKMAFQEEKAYEHTDPSKATEHSENKKTGEPRYELISL